MVCERDGYTNRNHMFLTTLICLQKILFRSKKSSLFVLLRTWCIFHFQAFRSRLITQHKDNCNATKKASFFGSISRKSHNNKIRRAQLKLINSASASIVPISVIPGQADSDLEEEDDPEDVNEGSTSGNTNTLDYNDWFGSSEPTYPCPDCSKCFSDPDEVRIHLREDHGVVYCQEKDVKVFREKGVIQCKECDESFLDRQAYRVHHRNTHFILCTLCGQSFNHASYYGHMLRNHPEKEPTLEERTCGLCGKVAKTPSALYLHHRIYHANKSYSCSHCDYTTKFQNSINLHFKAKHTQQPTELPKFECNVCHKRFPVKSTMMDHMAVHTGVRRYACEFCDKTFTASTNYYKHRRKDHPEEYAKIKDKRVSTTVQIPETSDL